MAGKTSTEIWASHEGQEVNSPVLKKLGRRIAWHLPHWTRLDSIGATICG
jgi:hypothetical protein